MLEWRSMLYVKVKDLVGIWRPDHQEKNNFFLKLEKNVATNPEGGGGYKALVALKKDFFAASLILSVFLRSMSIFYCTYIEVTLQKKKNPWLFLSIYWCDNYMKYKNLSLKDMATKFIKWVRIQHGI